ncbi:MAG: HNH endonuclease [Armatimonadetes bacterium]|nr:HNH endonuclease [Armatimonadota bacterium]
MNPRYPRVAERAGERCEYCHAPEQVFNFAFEVEHILPRAAGGDDALDNLALACESCNLCKSDAVTGRDEATGADVPLFHPRRDRWHEHFLYDGDTGTIQGLTAAGRATVTRLRLNSDAQCRDRRHWEQLGLYP